ncbi:MAG: prepilin-type N-terminal cleavage/methylation domain-containing protein [Gemmatimonadaceae bacterium]
MQNRQSHTSRELSRRDAKSRAGFSLIEVLVAITIMAGVVLTMAMNTTTSSRNVTSSGNRSRAQAMVDQQVSRARSWPTYSTLGELSQTKYNPSASGLTTATTITVDSTSNRSITTVAVTVTGSTTRVLATPIKRAISIAAP